MQESFLVYTRFRYLKLAAVLLLAALAAYAVHDPVDPPNGGTWLGYTLGGLAAALILWLAWFGVRKRRYASTLGAVQGWLSAHVYLGASLLLIATLHGGFQFGWNVHTLTYALMVLVILSGFYGVFSYARYPTLMTRNRGGVARGDPTLPGVKSGGGQTRDEMLHELGETEQEILSLAGEIDDDVHRTVLYDLEHTAIGGGVWHQLGGARPRRARGRIPVERFVADHMARASDPRKLERMRRLLELLGRRATVLRRLRRDIRYQGLMEIWLYFHVPLTFALLAALITHVTTVFFYW